MNDSTPSPRQPRSAFGLLAAAALLPALALLGSSSTPAATAAPAKPQVVPARAASAETRSCGRSGCHPDITSQWQSSSHSAGLDSPWYKATLESAKRSGEGTAAWCAGCHTPTSAPATAAAPAAGVSCRSCHVARPQNASSRKKDRCELKAVPHPEPAAAATCDGCHRGAVDETVNGYRWLRLFDDRKAWDPDNDANPSRIRYLWQSPGCLDCHMPRVASRDAGGEGGSVRSHRFAAANTALPVFRGDRAQLQAATDFLRDSRLTVDLFAMTHGSPAGAPPAPRVGSSEDVWGPLDRIPATVRRGESNRLDVVVRSRSVGHRFPGGKGDLGEVWLEVKAVDDKGRVIFWSGRADETSPVDPGAHFLRTVWTDEKGERVERHELWRARVAAWRQLVEPGAPHVARFRMDVPAEAGDRITVTASLRYRKLAWDFHRQVFAALGQAPPPLPITTLAEGSARLAVVEAGAALPDMCAPAGGDPAVNAERWNDYAVGLALQGDFPASRKAFDRVLALEPDHADALTNLALSVQSLSDAMDLLERVVKLDPRQARARYYLGGTKREGTHYDEALAQFRAAAELFPGDAEIRREIAATLLLKQDFPAAVAELERVLAVDPENAAAHLALRQAWRAQGDKENAERHLKLYERYQEDRAAQAWKKAFLASHPDDAREQAGVHEHRSGSLR